MENRYCVYGYFDKKTMVCKFLGYTKDQRLIRNKKGLDYFVLTLHPMTKKEAFIYKVYLQKIFNLETEPRDRSNDKRKPSKPSIYGKVVNCRGEIFNTIAEASRYYGISCRSSIGRCCRGEVGFVGKYPDGSKIKWKYKTKAL